MAFKFITLCALLAAANAGYVASPVVKYVNPAVDAVASTQQNVVRSFGGTVSSYSKSVQTPYSSVHKQDTRISNNVYTPAVAKTVTYAAPAVTNTVYEHAVPAVTKTVTYAAPAPVYTKALLSSPAANVNTYGAAYAPVVYSHAAPTVTKTVYAQAAPAVTKTVTYAAPAPVYTKALVTSPVAAAHTPVVYSQAAPVVKQAIAYSPAATVAHVSFDGFGSHWGY